jgi:hypothetical protein
LEKRNMESKKKRMIIRQTARFEHDLQERMSFLSGKGIESPRADKDPIVRKLKADVKASNNRLRLIAENEKRTEEMAKIKAERAAAPRKEEEAGKGEKAKKGPEEGKAKKAKPAKVPEGGKPREKKESPEAGKAKTEKKGGE